MNIYTLTIAPTGLAVRVPGPVVTDPFPSGARSKDGTFKDEYINLHSH
jgi:hypothetical protein